jgi:peptide/nickel transport system ATP-binding protein
MNSTVLEVHNLKTWFYTRRGIVKAVNGMSYSLEQGECVCLVGESGCGKSVSALSILRLFDSPPGKIVEGKTFYGDVNLTECSMERLREIRGREIAMVFQNAQSALNPVFTIGDQIDEQIRTHFSISRHEALQKARYLMEEMSIPDPDRALGMYAHQMSGGMRQRAMIAMSLSCDPKILIADEPTTAVDVTIRVQIISLLAELKRTRNMSIIFITHDLSLVREIGDRAAVVYAGKVVEFSSVGAILNKPFHPYTIGLIGCLPDISSRDSRLPSIPGNTPSPIDIPSGCPFHPRCSSVMDICRLAEPRTVNIAPGHTVACHLFEEREID